MIAAVIGEELGLFGILMLVALYLGFAYGALRVAQRARDRYGQLLVAGLAAGILVQATINLFAVFGMMPLTGVTLPLVSYGNSSLIVTLASVGLILNVASGGTAAAKGGRGGRGKLRVVEGGRSARTTRRAGSKRASSSNRHGRDSRSHRSGARRRRRA
jgi:cell division protein FtsW